VADNCASKTCFAPETGCNLGESLASCPHYRRLEGLSDHSDGGPAGPLAASAAELIGRPVPWTGSSLGSVDLGFLAARSPLRMVAVLGDANAGKTTLLSTLYLLLHAGERVAQRSFAGSFTLGGWNAVSRSLRWAIGRPPQFPPHTPASTGRIPGLLHLAFRRLNEPSGLDDVVFTDPPGEWYRQWAIDREAADSAGARWIATNSDVFLFLIDSEALAGQQRQVARERVVALAERLRDAALDRPVAIVWTKSDVVVPDGVREATSRAVASALPGHATFSVCVPPDRPMDLDSKAAHMNVLSWALTAKRVGTGWGMPEGMSECQSSTRVLDPFLMFRSGS
jgi:hypothetical protein